MIFNDERETKLDAEIDEEWEKFLSEARGTYDSDDKATYEKFKLKKTEEARTEYYRSLVTKDIIQITDDFKQ